MLSGISVLTIWPHSMAVLCKWWTKLMEVKCIALYRGCSHSVIWWWRRQNCNISCHLYNIEHYFHTRCITEQGIYLMSSCLIQLFINTFSARHKISRVPGSPFLGTNSHSYFILCAVYWLGGCFQSGNEWVKMNPLTYMFNLLLCCIHTYICTLHTYMNL